MADYVQLLEAHDILQARIDRALEVLEKEYSDYTGPCHFEDFTADKEELAIKILKGEV